MIVKYLRIKNSGEVAIILPETDRCWYNAGLAFVVIANTDRKTLFYLIDTEYITKKEYFKGCLSG